MGCFLVVLQLFLMLQGLDEGLLGQVLSVSDVLHQMVDLYEDTPGVFRHKAVLPFQEVQAGVEDVTHSAQ